VVRTAVASIRVRLLGAIFMLLTASTLATMIGERRLLLDDAIARVDDGLRAEARQLRAHTARGGTLDVFLRQHLPDDNAGMFAFVGGALVGQETGRELPASVAAQVATLGRERTPALDTTDLRGSGQARYLREPVPGGSLVVLKDLSSTEARATRTARNSALLALAILASATAIAWVVAGRILAPLRRLRETASAITESDLTRRLDVRGDDELARLAVTFNAMLDRLEAAFGAQRAFVSDVGHELRTPITIIRAHLDLVGDDPAERQATLALVADELQRMSRLVEGMLTLARAEQSDFLRREDIDLDELAEGLLARARALGPREWVLEQADPGFVHADRERLTQAVMNLAANAVAHTAPGDRITLSAQLRRDEAVLSVTDTGPGVAVADRERIFERSQGDGTGLGLSIVRVIADAHGGRVELSSIPGAGATFAIHVPVDPEVNAVV
jgi:signal transduction histidine kinase